MLKQLEVFLKKSRTKFSKITHKIVYTAHDEAQTTKKKLGEIAKVVLVKVDLPRLASGKAGLGFALVVIPAGKYVDLGAIKKSLKAKKISLAKEEDIAKYLKTKVGLLHPFGNLYKIPTLLDNALAKSKKLVTAAGSYTESLEIAIKDFEKIVEPIKGVFSKTKR